MCEFRKLSNICEFRPGGRPPEPDGRPISFCEFRKHMYIYIYIYVYNDFSVL